jgi:DNA-binding response OmpR family regulator
MSKRILIFDDDKDILEVLSYILTEHGYEIKAYTDGKYVFEAIKSFHPDLVLMDVMLDDMDGRMICRDIKTKSETQTVPVILISASHDLSLALEQQGAPNDFIAKPFDIDYLLNKVEKQLAA